jgi:hypothetical protein
MWLLKIKGLAGRIAAWQPQFILRLFPDFI